MTEKAAADINAYILLDRSGSMATHWAETIGSLNAYVEGLAGEKATKKALVTVAAFDSADPFTVMRSSMRADEWKAIAASEIAPRASTPLYDAIGRLVDTIRTANPSKAAIVIITDGQENDSREIKKEAAKAMLDEMRAKGFDVVFLGADFDAFGQGASLGNAAGQTLNMAAGNYDAAMKGLSMRTANYASTGKVEQFSDDLRQRAAGGK
jgi:Mg-chelatase subunit ChlD